jgi:predicted MFS family arabinose efflux permease
VWRRVAVDTSALQASRDLRWLVGGNVVDGLATQAALVALPYQVYTQTHSAFLTGLLGLVELGPVMAMALWGGAMADRADRRRILLVGQVLMALTAAALAAGAFVGDPPLALIYVLAACMAGFGSVQQVTRSAMVPALVAPEKVRSALALSFGLYSLTMVIGPGLGGLLIGLGGVGAAYAVSAGLALVIIPTLLPISPQLPHREEDHVDLGVGASIREGLRFVRGEPALLGSFAIDLMAMTFGMPRALFAVLSLTVYHAGPEGTGLLYAAVSAGATVAALTTGWLEHARWLGRIVIVAVIVWGGAIALAGVTSSLWIAAAMLAIAGAADSVSAVCRSAINMSVTPDHMRGRMSSVFTLVVTSGPRLGDLESGAAAGLVGTRMSVTSGGLACIAGVGLIVAAFPALAAYDGDRHKRVPTEGAEGASAGIAGA